jgi:hypothetical protein
MNQHMAEQTATNIEDKEVNSSEDKLTDN